jgi:phenylacetate-coenzyme A ligase PaaK-like adenylate-forming protein
MELDMDTMSYERLRQQHIRDALARAPAQLERSIWPPQRRQAERSAALRALLRVARQRSPWHRERLTPIDVDRLTAADLSALPTMNKADVMTHFDALVTDPRLTRDAVETHLSRLSDDGYLFDQYHVVASGGTSGYRGVYVYDWAGWIDAFFSLTRDTLSESTRDPTSPIAQGTRVSITSGKPWHMGDALMRTFATPQLPVTRIAVDQPLPALVDALNRANPLLLAAFPSVLQVLASEARAGRLQIAPRRIVSNSEPLLPGIRAALRETWGAQVVNAYATSETGGIACSCPDGEGLHVAEDLCILELVDARGQPVPAGTRCEKILVTNLFNYAMPLIRYEIADELMWLEEPCSCGSTRRRIADIHGRASDRFAYAGDVTIHPLAFLSWLDKKPEIIEYQVRQTPKGARVLLRLSQSIELAALRTSLVTSLAEFGLRGAEISISVVGELDRLASGKLQRFVPLPLPDELRIEPTGAPASDRNDR